MKTRKVPIDKFCGKLLYYEQAIQQLYEFSEKYPLSSYPQDKYPMYIVEKIDSTHFQLTEVYWQYYIE